MFNLIQQKRDMIHSYSFFARHQEISMGCLELLVVELHFRGRSCQPGDFDS